MVSFNESIYSRIDKVEFLLGLLTCTCTLIGILPLYYTMACKVIHSSSLWWVISFISILEYFVHNILFHFI